MRAIKLEEVDLIRDNLGSGFLLTHDMAEDPGMANRQVRIDGILTLDKGLTEGDFCKIAGEYSELVFYKDGNGIRTAIEPGSCTVEFGYSGRGGIDDYSDEFDELVEFIIWLGYRAAGSVHITDDFGGIMVQMYFGGKKEAVYYGPYDSK